MWDAAGRGVRSFRIGAVWRFQPCCGPSRQLFALPKCFEACGDAASTGSGRETVGKRVLSRLVICLGWSSHGSHSELPQKRNTQKNCIVGMSNCYAMPSLRVKRLMFFTTPKNSFEYGVCLNSSARSRSNNNPPALVTESPHLFPL